MRACGGLPLVISLAHLKGIVKDEALRCRRGSLDPLGRRVCPQRGGDSEDAVSTLHRVTTGHGRPGYTGGVVQRGGCVWLRTRDGSVDGSWRGRSAG